MVLTLIMLIPRIFHVLKLSMMMHGSRVKDWVILLCILLKICINMIW